MYQRDFILRMIEELATLVAGILGLLKKGDYNTARKQLSNAYSRYLKEEAAVFLKLPLDQLPEILERNHNFDTGQMEMLAGLFFAEAECLSSENKKPEADSVYRKALKLYEHVTLVGKTFSLEREERIDYIQTKLL